MGLLELFFWGLVGTFSGPGQTLNHRVEASKMVKDGHIKLKTGADHGGESNIKIDYDLQTKWFAPVGDQKGSVEQVLPTKYLTEEGYREIERKGSVNYQDVHITFLGRLNFGSYRNGYKIKVDKSGEWSAIALYHPKIAATGWGYLTLTLYKVPVLGSYTINSHME